MLIILIEVIGCKTGGKYTILLIDICIITILNVFSTHSYIIVTKWIEEYLEIVYYTNSPRLVNYL